VVTLFVTLDVSAREGKYLKAARNREDENATAPNHDADRTRVFGWSIQAAVAE